MNDCPKCQRVMTAVFLTMACDHCDFGLQAAPTQYYWAVCLEAQLNRGLAVACFRRQEDAVKLMKADTRAPWSIYRCTLDDSVPVKWKQWASDHEYGPGIWHTHARVFHAANAAAAPLDKYPTMIIAS